MQTQKIYCKIYDEKIECPIIVISGKKKMPVVRAIEAIGIDPKVILTCDDEEELEAFAGEWSVLFCNKFVPTYQFVQNHKEWRFISTENSAVPMDKNTSKNYHYSDNFLYFNFYHDIDQNISRLGDWIGINAFKNLRWDEQEQIWVSLGKPTPIIDHNLLTLSARLAKESAKWIAAGSPWRSQNIIDTIYDTFCSKCSDFIKSDDKNHGKCNICGCYLGKEKDILNKIAMATTSCPRDTPSWTPDVAVSEEAIKGREAELRKSFVEQQKAFSSQEGRICACPEEEL